MWVEMLGHLCLTKVLYSCVGWNYFLLYNYRLKNYMDENIVYSNYFINHIPHYDLTQMLQYYNTFSIHILDEYFDCYCCVFI